MAPPRPHIQTGRHSTVEAPSMSSACSWPWSRSRVLGTMWCPDDAQAALPPVGRKMCCAAATEWGCSTCGPRVALSMAAGMTAWSWGPIAGVRRLLGSCGCHPWAPREGKATKVFPDEAGRIAGPPPSLDCVPSAGGPEQGGVADPPPGRAGGSAGGWGLVGEVEQLGQA